MIDMTSRYQELTDRPAELQQLVVGERIWTFRPLSSLPQSAYDDEGHLVNDVVLARLLVVEREQWEAADYPVDFVIECLSDVIRAQRSAGVALGKSGS